MVNIEFNKKIVNCGNDFVAVRIIENGDEQKYGNIYLPDSADANGRLAHCQIVSIGENAKEKLGVNVDDYVMIDRLATFAHTAPIAALKYDSVICKTNSDKTDFFPLKDTMFIEPDSKSDVTNVGGVYMLNYANKLNLGTVVKIGFETTSEWPFSIGSKVMLMKGGDLVKFSDKVVHIYKKDMIVCTVEDENTND